VRVAKTPVAVVDYPKEKKLSIVATPKVKGASPIAALPKAKETPKPTETALDRFHRVFDEYKGWWSALGASPSTNCRESGELTFGLPDGRKVTMPDMFWPESIPGSQGEIFISNDKKLLMKVGRYIPGAFEIILDMQTRDIAALAAMNGNASPKVHFPVKNSFLPKWSDDCYMRTVFMDYAGSNTLGNLRDSHSNGVPSEKVITIGRSAIALLKKVHAAGLLHGDVHAGNFVYSSDKDVDTNLRIIDFGRSLPYMDKKTNTRIPPSKMKAIKYPQAQQNSLFLSINEVKGNPITPNDDLFRLAEVLMDLATGPMGYRIDILFGIHTKESYNCRGQPRIPASVCTLFERTRAAKFDDPPIYDL
jgi:serine/threonine protein kinase